MLIGRFLMSVPNQNLIYCVPIQTYFVDKDTGAPLSAGVVTFYEDDNRTVLKNVYQQSNTPPYTFTLLNNPVTLSGVGTFQDGNGNDINVYLYPYEGSKDDVVRGAEQLYYIEVYSSDGVLQETRSAWPPSVGADFGSAAATNSLNQITNTQFVEVLFETPTTYTVSGTDTSTEIAPGWFVLTSGSGTFTVSQVAVPSGTSTDLTAAPYELTISSASISSISLYQRINGSPLLLAGGNVYGYAQIASTGGAQIVSIVYSDSDGNDTILAGPVNTNSDNSFTTVEGTSVVLLQATGTAPTAYVDFSIILVAGAEFKITSCQMIAVASTSSMPGYFQQSVPQQENGLYYYDKPIVPVGTIIDFGGFGTPLNYLSCDGEAYNRISYNLLFQAITTTETVTLTSTSATFTVANGSVYRIGMGVENAGIPANTTITGISGNTITISSAATSSGATSVRFFAAGLTYSETVSLTSSSNTFTVSSAANYGIGMAITGNAIQADTVVSNIVGTTITMSKTATATQSSLVTFYAPGNGDGSTTFNVYDLRDYVIAGEGGSLFGASSNGLGARGGESTHTMTVDELVAHTHPPLSGTNFVTLSGSTGATSGAFQGLISNATTGSRGNGQPFNIVQQTALMKKCIRYK